MALTDTAIRNARPGAKPVKLSDEKGLFLLLQPSGGKLWRLKYRVDGREKKLSLGRYPEVSLKDARQRRDDARTQLANGIDPGLARKATSATGTEAARNTFGSLAEEYLSREEQKGRAQVTMTKARWMLALVPELIDRPITGIKPAELLASLRKIEARGHRETARRMLSLAARVFRFAIQESRAELDITPSLRGALLTPDVKHHSAVLKPEAVGQLLRAIDGYQGAPLTALALKLSPHVFVRPGELRRAEWSELDLVAAVWTIPAAKMKMREPHRVPLSRQVIELFRTAAALGSGTGYIFCSLYSGQRAMSENTINAALRRLGFGKDEMTAHGFRSTASTLLNESRKWSADAIERALAHRDSSAVRGIYHRGQHWDERVAMAQWWSDYLDQLKARSYPI